MTKSELVEKLSFKLRSLSKTEVEIIVDTLFNKMTEALKRGDRIELRGFGTFEVRHRPARQGRNPKTGATVYVKNRRVPFFKVGKELKDRVNEAAMNQSLAEQPAHNENQPNVGDFGQATGTDARF